MASFRIRGSHNIGEANVTPEGIGGWLYLPAIGLVVGVPSSVFSLVLLLSATFDLSGHEIHGILVLNLLVCVGLTAFVIYAAVQFFGKKRNAPTIVIALYIAQLAGNAFLSAINFEPLATEYGQSAALGLIPAIIWIPYFVVSKRVKRTFVIGTASSWVIPSHTAPPPPPQVDAEIPCPKCNSGPTEIYERSREGEGWICRACNHTWLVSA